MSAEVLNIISNFKFLCSTFGVVNIFNIIFYYLYILAHFFKCLGILEIYKITFIAWFIFKC